MALSPFPVACKIADEIDTGPIKGKKIVAICIQETPITINAGSSENSCMIKVGLNCIKYQDIIRKPMDMTIPLTIVSFTRSRFPAPKANPAIGRLPCARLFTGRHNQALTRIKIPIAATAV